MLYLYIQRHVFAESTQMPREFALTEAWCLCPCWLAGIFLQGTFEVMSLI